MLEREARAGSQAESLQNDQIGRGRGLLDAGGAVSKIDAARGLLVGVSQSNMAAIEVKSNS